MKIAPAQGPLNPAFSTGPTPSQQAAKERAIARLTGTPVPQDAKEVPRSQPAPLEAPTHEDAGPEIPQPGTQLEALHEETEAPVEEPKSPTPKEDPQLANKYAQLAKRERAIRQKQVQQEQAIKAREDALAAREAQLAAKDQEYSTGYIPKAKLKQQTLDVLAEEGISYDELTTQILNQPNRDPRAEAMFNELRNEIKALKQANDDAKKANEEHQSQQYKAAVNQIRTDVKTLVQHDPEFETIRSTNSIGDVVELIERTFQKDGIVLSVEEAAREVEEYLVEEAMSLTKIGKIKQRLQMAAQSSKPQVAQTPQAPQAQQSQQPMKTLTNSVSTSRKLSARERAIAAAEGRLK